MEEDLTVPDSVTDLREEHWRKTMLTHADLSAWAEIQDGLARAAERDWQARVMWEHYERLRREITKQIGGCLEGQ